MKFEIGEPEHGWVRIKLSHNGLELEFNSSDVPNNPIAELILAIESVLNGADSSVWWHLEPEGYYFKFTKVGSELVFEVMYSVSSLESQAKSILLVRGSCYELLMPFWRALRKFETFNYKEQNWPMVNFSSLAKIELKLKNG
ncbi:hypothetical protein [Cellvibrio fibrivorans]|uniref:Uncharacterized protein n=1 Tax=Cellvibrio fibrivorans TaxID=126350 RepID=A0ABU1V4J9_9GAMM|nr:hypothetical protein [Cellvibrio fibrivorans]MDR7092258.1 hypothetical protein [Cellvibrio fibrivorans]